MIKIKGPSYKALVIMIIILSLIWYSITEIAKSNVMIVRDGVEKQENGEVAKTLVGYEVEYPKFLEGNCEVEVDRLGSIIHAWNDMGEMVACRKPRDGYEYFSGYSGDTQEYRMEDVGNITDIVVDYVNEEDITMISYNSDNTSYGVIILGEAEEQFIAEEVLNIKQIDGIEYRVNEECVSIKNSTEDIVIVKVDDTACEEERYYNCIIENDGYYHRINYTYGIGQYTVGIYKQTDKEYICLVTETVNHSSDTKYTYSSYNAEYTKYSEGIDKIIRDNGWGEETCIEEIFDYMKTYEYDDMTAEKINSGEVESYIVDINKTIESKRGICSDIASLTVCIARRLGMEARYCVGSTGDTDYHAWAEIYDEECSEWKNVDTIKKRKYLDGESTEIKAIQYY